MASNFMSKLQLLFSIRFLATYVSFLVTNPPSDLDIIDVAKKISVALENETEWERFGMHLLNTTDKQDLISIQQKERGNSLENKCKSLLELWKKRTHEPKWEQVVQALTKVNLNELCARLQAALRIEPLQDTFVNCDSSQQGVVPMQGEYEVWCCCYCILYNTQLATATVWQENFEDFEVFAISRKL